MSLLFGVISYTPIITELIFVLESAVTKACNMGSWPTGCLRVFQRKHKWHEEKQRKDLKGSGGHEILKESDEIF